MAIGHMDVIRPAVRVADTRLAGESPAASTAHPVVKFHAPEIVFGVGALAESGFTADSGLAGPLW